MTVSNTNRILPASRAALDAVDENVSQRRGELGLMSRSANSNVGKIHIARLEKAVLALIATT